MAESHEIVTVVIVEDTTIEVISCERGGTQFYFWRLIKDDKIVETNASLWPTAGEALDKAMARVLPNVGIKMIEEPDAQDFEMLNMLLLWETPNGPVSSLYEAVQWHNTLVDGSAKLEAAEEAAKQDMEMVLDALASVGPKNRALVKATETLAELMQKQFELARHCNEREIKALASFIENFLGSRS